MSSKTFYRLIPAEVEALVGALGPTAASILAWFRAHRPYGGQLEISTAEIAQLFNLSVRTIQRIIKRLIEGNFLSRIGSIFNVVVDKVQKPEPEESLQSPREPQEQPQKTGPLKRAKGFFGRAKPVETPPHPSMPRSQTPADAAARLNAKLTLPKFNPDEIDLEIKSWNGALAMIMGRVMVLRGDGSA